MKKCPYCAEAVQDEAIVCRYCGRDLAAPQAPPMQVQVVERKKKTSCGTLGCLALVVLVVFSAILGEVISDDNSVPGPVRKPVAAAEASRRLVYEIVREWTIPNGGHGRVVLLHPNHRNEEDLRALGEILKYESRRDRHAFVHIFDDSRAAAMYERALHLGPKDGKHYDRHFIATYTRNMNTGFHKLEIFLSGPKGPTIEVVY